MRSHTESHPRCRRLADLDRQAVVEHAVAEETLPSVDSPDEEERILDMLAADKGYLAAKGLSVEQFDGMPAARILRHAAFKEWLDDGRFEELFSNQQRVVFRKRFDAFARRMNAALKKRGSIRAWRAIGVSGIESDPVGDIVSHGLGKYWSHVRAGAQTYWDNGGETYVLEADIREDQIDWFMTAVLNVSDTAVEEKEIRAAEDAAVVLTAVYDPEGNKIKDARIGSRPWGITEEGVRTTDSGFSLAP